MKKIMETQKKPIGERFTWDWLRYEITEDDFLSGKTSEFSYCDWEQD